MAQCKYTSEVGEVQCEEQELPDSSNGYCIFHEELENKDIDACMKAFYEKIITGETNFEGFILKDVNFSKPGISQIGSEESSMWFNNAKFYGDFLVNGVKFFGFTSFLGAEFYGNADFGNTSFSNGAIFDSANFFGKTNFLLVDFFREARFSSSTFCETSEFVNVTFRGPAFFGSCKFDKVANFTDTVFERGGSFNQAKMSFALFENTELKNVSFDEVNLTNFKFHGAKLKDANLLGAIWNSPWKSPWRKFILREDIETIKAKKICKECSTLIIDDDTVCDRCGSDHVEINKDFSDNSYRANLFKKAEDVYRNIKLNLQDGGDYKTAGEFYFNEMVMRRKRSLRERNILDWFISHLNSKLCGYGERANRVIAGSLIVVFSLALIFFVNHAVVRQGFTSHSPDFLECLYFSSVTFTTLGYGDYAPTQAFQLVAIAEAFFGVFMIALFVLVFGRKMLR